MKLSVASVVAMCVFTVASCTPVQAQGPASGSRYYPTAAWERKLPVELGMDGARIDSAVAFHVAHEGSLPRDIPDSFPKRLAGRPYSDIVGPLKARGGPNGIIIKNGYIIREWGDTRRVDMTFSVTKSFLAAVAGVAFDRRMIRDVDDSVRDYVPELFESGHNRSITWRNLLQQTSEWEGTLWDKPDLADRRRGRDRALQSPGTFWEYNDVRVNLAALSLLHVWRKPLPDVLRDEIMHPIGASDSWEWHGYRNSYVTIDGKRMQSVSGGGHWGGGMWISSRDLARFGLLFARSGQWQGRQLISRDWIEMLATPGVNRSYGFMWWLNTDGAMWPHVSHETLAALGGGTNIVWVDRQHDLVVVLRWIDRAAIDRVLDLIERSVESD